MNTGNYRFYAIADSVAFTAMIFVNALANILPINGLNTGQVSDLYPSLFTPAGFTFSIWTVIYFMLGVFVITQWRTKSATAYNVQLSRRFLVSCVLNICWIIAWHYLIVWLSVLIMLMFLLILIKMFLQVQEDNGHSRHAWFYEKLPFTTYLAWISVATIANVAAYLTSLKWSGGPLTPTAWTIMMMIAATVLAIVLLGKYRAYAFGIVVMWALFGITSKDLPHITHAGGTLIIMIMLTSIYLLFKKPRETVVHSSRSTVDS